jgi:hypothetical protein
MRIRDRAIQISRAMSIFLFIAMVIFVAFGWFERERNKDEEYAVYSAYLSDGLLDDPHDWSTTGGPARVVIWNKTISGGDFRFPWFHLFDRRVHFGEFTRAYAD